MQYLNMLKLALFVVCVAVATCQPHNPGHEANGHHGNPTHPTHPTHPTDAVNLNADHINDKYKFEFEEKSGYMILNTHDTCYLWKLSDSEVALVKDPATLTTIESQMFAKIGDGSSTTQVDKSSLDHEVAGKCEHHQNIMEFGAAAAGSTASA